MEKPENVINVPVVWRGNKYVIELPSNSFLKDLGIKLQRLTNVKPDTMKLIVSLPSEKISKLLTPLSDDHSGLSLLEASIFEGKLIRMMGVPDDEVETFLRNAKVDMRIAGFEEEEKRTKQKLNRKSHPSIKFPVGPYIFCDFRTLEIPGLKLNPPASEALKLMHKLASDPGIVAIMNKHRWRVGIMTEMAPEGYVGISPVCLLGFNKNNGEEISLRLRTDDLKGFRKYESIKKTLLHELAHMVYSEHDANFYALDKQLNLEVNTLDWTKSNGRTLSSISKNYDKPEQYEEDEADVIHVGHKLGGNSSHQSFNASASAAAAAFYRLSATSSAPSIGDNEPVSVDKLGEECPGIVPPVDDNFLPSDSDRANQSGMQPDRDESFINQNPGTISSIYEDHEARQSHGILPNYPDFKTDEQSEAGISGRQEEPTSYEDLRSIQDPVTLLSTRLQNAIEKLRTEFTASVSGSILQTLLKIVRNVINHPGEDKYKKLRKANPIIQRNVASHRAAMEVLLIIGFMEDAIIDDGRREEYLVLKRDDPGLLWLAKSSLEAFV